MANTITLTDLAAGSVYAGDRANASIAVAGTYTVSGATPAIQAQAIESGDLWGAADLYAITDLWTYKGAVVVAWTTIVASPTGGTFSGTLSVPLHASLMFLEVRFADASAESDGTHQFGVGYVILDIGQSNEAGLWSQQSVQGVTGAPPLPDPRASYYVVNPSTPGWVQPCQAGQNFGDGLIALVNALIPLVNAPVGVILGAVGGTALVAAAANPSFPNQYWLNTGGVTGDWPNGYLFGACRDAISAVGGDISAINWLQGEQEVTVGGVSQAAYAAGLQSLYPLFLALTPRTKTNLLFHVGIIGFASYGATVVDGIRAAQKQVGNGGNGFQLGPPTYDLPISNDGGAVQHHTAAGYVTLGHRWAAQLAYWLGTPGTFYPRSGAPPQITGATRQGKYLIVTVAQPPVSGGAFLGGLSPGADLTGFSFSTDNFLSTLTPVSIRTMADFSNKTQIGVIFATDPGKQVQLRYQDGQPVSFFPIPSVANVCYGGGNPPSEPLGIPLAPTAGIITSGDANNFAGFPVFPTLTGLGFDVVRSSRLSTNVQENISGKQTATAYWSSEKYSWELLFNALWSGGTAGQFLGALPAQDWQALQSFFNQLVGRLDIFLYQDPDDCQAIQQFIGIGDGSTTAFQIVRTLGVSGQPTPILAANFDTAGPTGIGASVFLNGIGTGTASYSRYGTANPGILTFSPAPPQGAIITATFSYFWPCRFDDDTMTFNKFMSQLWANKKVGFTSVKN